MMRVLLLLFVFTSGAHAQECDTGIVVSGHVLNIAGSQMAKASVDFVHAFNSSSLQECLDHCCSGKFGLCSIATYRSQPAQVNCLHFYCRPVSHCKFYPSITSDSFSFPATEIKESTSQLSANISNLSKAHHVKSLARSVSARKGAENNVVSRKGVWLNNVTAEIFSLKNDNTTIKPRKGVEFPVDKWTQSTSSVINPTEKVANENFTNGRKPKIKPRKGVEDTSLHITPTRTMVGQVVPITSTVHDQSSITLSLPHELKDNELISLLQNVFQDEINSREPLSKVQASTPHVPHESATLETIHTLEVLQPSTPPLDLRTSSPVFASSSSNVPLATVTEILSSSAWSSDSNTRFSTAQTTTNFFHSESHQSTRSSARFTYGKSLSILPSSTLGFETYNRFTPSPKIIPTSSHSFESVVPSTVRISVIPTASYFPKPQHAILYVAGKAMKPNHQSTQAVSADSETENERRYKSSMHLVISLVIGLVVLFAVLGAVAKRIYDVWMRRHYHRMDFLIDGLYDGYS